MHLENLVATWVTLGWLARALWTYTLNRMNHTSSEYGFNAESAVNSRADIRRVWAISNREGIVMIGLMPFEQSEDIVREQSVKIIGDIELPFEYTELPALRKELAEAVRFELTVELPLRQFSRLLP